MMSHTISNIENNFINLNVDPNYVVSMELELSKCLGNQLIVFTFSSMFTQCFNVVIPINTPISTKNNIKSM